MLLDNHYGPDPRVAFETRLLDEAGISTRIIAWDRRAGNEARDGLPSWPEVVRIAIPAPRGGGWRSLVALTRLTGRLWRGRKRLVNGASLLIVHDIYLLPLGWLLARRLRLPFVYDAHEEYRRMEALRYPSWLLRLVTALESRLARSAVAVVVPGASRTSRWNDVAERPPIILPNLVRRDQPRPRAGLIEWDLVYAGTLSDGRRLDLLFELARFRPSLRIGIAGRGRSADDIARTAAELPNLTYLGWRSDTDALFARARAIYYGLDPEHPYSEVACPNTLYEALRHRKPLIFFCGGEMAQLSAEFKIGIRCRPSVASLSAALDIVSATSDWEFEAAWRAAWERAETRQFVEIVEVAVRRSH